MSESESIVLGMIGTSFIILKLCGVINWSWAWVLAPFWLPIAIVLIAFVIMYLKEIWEDLHD